ncbi:MAG: large conductance mechanosensitive channel protein MscL [Lachnospiraceae bacterium]|nr:large conductance mechanosensitive channel protein MscL [Lachnospiraceae bacterium]
MKNFIKEFKEFISKGDVMSMAVGIIIGGAFTAIITSIVNDLIGPIIGMICGGIDFSALAVQVGDASLMVGNFIQAVINFLITALVLFCILKTFNKAKEKMDALKKKEEEKAAEESPAADIVLLTEIRDLLKNQK